MRYNGAIGVLTGIHSQGRKMATRKFRLMSNGVSVMSYFCVLAIALLVSISAIGNAHSHQGSSVLHRASVAPFPLYHAIYHDDVAKVKSILAGPATSDQEVNEMLRVAAGFGYVGIIKALLSDDAADVDTRGKNGWTPLIWAANLGHPEAVKVLLAAGASVDSRRGRGSTALIYAAKKGHFKVADILLAAGADPDIRDGRGVSSRKYAKGIRKMELVFQKALKRRAEEQQ